MLLTTPPSEKTKEEMYPVLTQFPPLRQDLSQQNWRHVVLQWVYCQGCYKQFCTTLNIATYEEWGKQICPGVLWWVCFLCVFFQHHVHLIHNTKMNYKFSTRRGSKLCCYVQNNNSKLPSKTSVFLLNAGSFTTSSYVTRSNWSNTKTQKKPPQG